MHYTTWLEAWRPQLRTARLIVLLLACASAAVGAWRGAAHGAPARAAGFDPLEQAQWALFNEDVRAAVPFGGRPGHPAYIAALVAESVAAWPERRWVVLLDHARGYWRVRSRHHTRLPVDSTAGSFGAADLDGDGRPEVFAVSTAWSFSGYAAGVDVIDPRGAEYGYALNGVTRVPDGSGAWTENLAGDAPLLAWMAGTAHRALLRVAATYEQRGTGTSLIRDDTPLDSAQALEEARQRLGWTVRRAIPLPRHHWFQRIAVLYGSALNVPELAVLEGSEHIYGAPWKKLVPELAMDDGGNFGLVDVDHDGNPEIYAVETPSGTAEWDVKVMLYDPEANAEYHYTITQFEGEPAIFDADAALAHKRGARAWMDSTARAQARRAFDETFPLHPRR